MIPAYYDMQCKNETVAPVVDVGFVTSECPSLWILTIYRLLVHVLLSNARFVFFLARNRSSLLYWQSILQLPRCKRWLKESCTDITDSISCAAALTFCSTTVVVPFMDTGKKSFLQKIIFLWGDVLLGMNPYDITKIW